MAVRFAPAQWRWWRFLLTASLLCAALVATPASTAENDHKHLRAALTGSSIEVVQTSANLSDALTRLPDLRFSGSRPNRGPVIKVDDTIHYQAVTGVGAAMTDSSAWLLHDELAPATRTAVMNDLFGVQGAHLGFMLVPMGGSDFTAKGRPYTYDDVPAGKSDPLLLHFSVAHDDGYIIPTLRQMLAINPAIKILATPWSPPAWMKANDALNDTKWKGWVLPSAYKALARYFVKFIQAYARRGVPIAAIAPQNEPQAPAPYPSSAFPEQNEAQWILEDLQPAIQAAGLSTRIYGGDVAWGAYHYVDGLISSQARSALTGIAWHCYGGISSGAVPNVMDRLNSIVPTLDQVVTECAPRLVPYPVSEILIGSLRSWASAVALWNVALDPSGGPVQPPNGGCGGCAGVITVDEHRHKVTFGLGYYQLGQVSRFVAQGATRVASNQFVSYYRRSSRAYGVSPGLDDVTFVNPNQSHVLVAYNNSAAPIRFSVDWRGSSFAYRLAPKATVTFDWNR